MTSCLSLARWACHPERSRGRLHPESDSPTRTCFQRDRDRIIHSSAFRRLEYKTQVFVNHEGDFFRTRLTHSLEVSQIARSICRSLALNEDLAEALTLAHDLGHPPFGHAGEDALREKMAPFGGFDHNAQSLRVITHLERRYADFDGLNLSWETLEGLVKHNGPVGVGGQPVPTAIAEYQSHHDLDLQTYASAEAQVASLADDIAYNNHDIDDGLRADLFDIEALATVPIAGEIIDDVMTRYPALDRTRLIHETVRCLITRMIHDLLTETKRRIADLDPLDADDIRRAGQAMVGFSSEMAEHDRALKAFLFENMYRHYKLNRMSSKARRLVRDLFQLFVDEPGCLPNDWRRLADAPATATTARVVADYIAGMTDRFAADEHRRLFDVNSRIS